MISLVVLPALACVLMIGFPLFDERTHVGRTRVVSSARLFRIHWMRCLVIALIVGSVVGFVFGRQGYQPLLVGVATTVALMVPATLILYVRKLVLSRRRSRESEPVLRGSEDKEGARGRAPGGRSERTRREDAANTRSDKRTATAASDRGAEQRVADIAQPRVGERRANPTAESGTDRPGRSQTARPERDDQPSLHVGRERSSRVQVASRVSTERPSEAATLDVEAPVEHESTAASGESATRVKASQPDTATVPAVDDAATTQTAARPVDEQLDVLDDNIRSYTFGEDSGEAPRAPSTAVEIDGDTGEVATSQALLVPEKLDETSLQTYSRNELKSIVVQLSAEKRKYQKLVIAQKATLAAEREDHERTREIAVEATERLKRSRLEQRTAEKLARRERAQRLKLESRLDNVTAALMNAQSVLKQREAQRENLESELG